MPHLHCTKCQHEYEASDLARACDWCGAPGRVLEEKTPLERMLERILPKEEKR